MKKENIVVGVIYDPISRVLIPGKILIEKGKIGKIERDDCIKGPIILPGFVDSHIHIESSMLLPVEFSRIAKRHGTIAVVADPHEIANVAGVEGIDFMINNSKDAEIQFYFGAPSCVPASPFDDCYKVIDSVEIEKMLIRDDIYFLGEMMNFPGVINSDQDVISKIEAAKRYGKQVDGHAPGLKAESLSKYIRAGITTDHECFTLEEAEEKISKGMKVLIREGSAAKNFNTLNPLVNKNPEVTMVCTDDCHPEDLIEGHINNLVKKSLAIGYNIFDIIQVVSVNPIKHYRLDLGLLQVGDSADFIVVDNLVDLRILASYVKGVNILENEKTDSHETKKYNLEYVFTKKIDVGDLKLAPRTNKLKAIDVIEGELVTKEIVYNIKTQNQSVISDIENDILKIVVVNRYKEKEVFVGFIKGFGLKKGAIAESIAHDSHHIIAVGVDDRSIFKVLEYVINQKGGLCYFDDSDIWGLPLPIYGLISDEPAEIVAKKYKGINAKVAKDGCLLKAPFMTLSFMALSVIPNLKITPKGLFDVNRFKFIDQFI
jgi:adenine deaminase